MITSGAIVCGAAFVVGALGMMVADDPKPGRAVKLSAPIIMLALAAAYYAIVDARITALIPFVAVAVVQILLGFAFNDAVVASAATSEQLPPEPIQCKHERAPFSANRG